MQIRFADFTLDEDRYLLERAGEPVTLRPKVFDLLVYLVCHRKRVVRREELVSELWDNVAVGDGALSGLVNELRQALGEQGRGPSSIRTVHARGYQFVAPVVTGVGVEAGRSPSEDAEGLDAIGRLIERVAEQGATGVVVEARESSEPGAFGRDPRDEGRSDLLTALLGRAEQTGFELYRLVAPDASQVSASRLARQIIESMIDRRGRAVVCAALPLPARRWLEDEVLDRVAGGLSPAGAGPPDPLGAIATLLRALACRRPLVILLEDFDRAGERFAADLLNVTSRLSRAPVLWVTPIPRSGATDACLARLKREAGFEHWIEPPPRRTELDRSLCQLGLDPLPEPLFDALAAHVRGKQAGLSAIAEWVASGGRKRSLDPGAASAADATAEERAERAAGREMRRVEPVAIRSELRSIR